MGPWPNRFRAALVLTILAAAPGCAPGVHGTAVKAPGGPPPGAVDISLLATGNLPTKPGPPLGNAGSAVDGALIEARRMANNVVGPWEVDPELVTPSPLRAMVIKDAAGLALIEPVAVATAAAAHHLINGFASDRQSLDQQRLTNAVVRFADPPSAAAAAADMAAAARTAQQPSPAPAPPALPALSVPGHPDARVVAGGDDQNSATVFGYTPHGVYVLCQIAHTTDTDAATALIAKTLDLQGPLIDQFAPTDPAKFADLPTDPTGLLARTMSPPKLPEVNDSHPVAPSNPKIGVYQPYGALHLQDDPPSAFAAFADAGVQLMSYNFTAVYQTADPDAAGRLASDLANSLLQRHLVAQPFNGVDFMPTSTCVQYPQFNSSTALRYECYAAVDTFTIETHATDPLVAHWQLAAQYLMLVAK
jgi:hypothetical protein